MRAATGKRVDLDGQADDFRYHLERAEPESALEECARWGLALVAECKAGRRVVEAAPPPFLLRAMADWLDLEDQVQRDLRALANALDVYHQAAGHAEPEGPP